MAEKSSPNEKSSHESISSPGGIAGAPSCSTKPVVQPRRLAHILVFTRDVPKTIKFYGEVLGLRLSDRSGDMIAFMHAIHGSDHHVIAFVKAEGPGLHHLSWDVPSINHIGLGAMQMADKGFIAGWGLGRHVLGSNYFHYVRDPWGSYSEYSSDVDYIPVDHDWRSGDHPPEDSFYVWGPTPPPEFAINHEVAARALAEHTAGRRSGETTLDDRFNADRAGARLASVQDLAKLTVWDALGQRTAAKPRVAGARRSLL